MGFRSTLFILGLGVGAASPEPAPVIRRSGGKPRKKRYAIEIEGKWLSFESLGDVEEYLEALKAEELEKVEEKAESVANKIILTGRAPKRAPKITVQSAPQEVREQVDLINAEIERVFWKKVYEEVAAKAEEEDIEILLL